MEKLKDLLVVTGSYTDAQGKNKNRYLKVGALMQNDKGQFIFLNRSFNPAGCPCKDGSESIIISMFDPKKQESGSELFDGAGIPF